MDDGFTWTYPYHEEHRVAGAGFLDKPLLRPAVRLKIVGDRPSSQIYVGLVDSGADHILAPEWVAREVGVDPDPAREIQVQIGGASRTVRFADVGLRLLPPEHGPLRSEPPLEWTAQVGFYLKWDNPPWLVVLGQCGFFDQFTVSMSRQSAAVAVSHRDDFDRRFGVPVAPPLPSAPPRFRP